MEFLYELRVSVEISGVAARVSKYPVKKTGKNYLPQMVTEELHKKHGCFLGLSSRVKLDDVLKVHRWSMQDSTSFVGRFVYFLEGQEEKVKDLVRKSVDDQIQMMKRDMDQLHDAWVTRKERPPRK